MVTREAGNCILSAVSGRSLRGLAIVRPTREQFAGGTYVGMGRCSLELEAGHDWGW